MTEQGTAIVTGAARGIGRAVVERLVRRGLDVVGIDRDGPAVDAMAAEVGREAGDGCGSVTGMAVDVSHRDAVEAAFAEIGNGPGPVRVLVNAAGITGATGIKAHEVDPEDFDAVYRVNLRAAFLLTRATVPLMLPHGYGRILHIASIAGKEGNAGMTAYSATKAGLIGLVKSAAKDYAEAGIAINALAPAVIRTAMVAAMPEHQVRYMTDRIPMKRTGTLDEAAAMIEFIVSPACAFTTGFTFDLSGGRATY